MKNLVKHLWRHNTENIVKRSFLNCHAKDLHSIMLLEPPGHMIRLFIAMPGNELYKNENPLGKDQVIAFHPHHCDLTLHCVKGSFKNWIIREAFPDDYNDHCFDIGKYKFNSLILEGKEQGGFTFIDKVKVKTVSDVIYRAGESVHMKAWEVHTVNVSHTQVTAWFVYEGEENKGYLPNAYSMADLVRQDMSELYQRPTYRDVERFLKAADLL